MMRFGLVVLALMTAMPALTRPAAAQNSILGVRGVGFPVRPLSARARSLGGGPMFTDPMSAMNPAAAWQLTATTAAAVMGAERRNYDASATAVEGIQQTRFPLIMVGGRLGALPLGYTLSFGKYAERTFDASTTDTLMLRGAPVEVQDRLASDGGIADVRGALAWSPTPAVRLGGAVHILSGSAKLRIRRTFADSAFRPYRQDNDAGFSGFGLSFGAVVTPTPGLNVAAMVRFDNDLSTRLDSIPAGRIDLPISAGGGVDLAPHPAIRIFLSAMWQGWSASRADLSGNTAAFDTWDLGGGIAIGGPESGTSRIPLRLGARYATLPFAVAGSDQPTELALAFGTGLPFAGNRAIINLALERVFRSGTGITERAWLLSAGMTVRP